MALTAAERLFFLVRCPRCGKGTEKMVAWLATNRQMRCTTPSCKALLNLYAPKYRTLIEKLVDQASELDALMIAAEQDK
jgi:hypothetical protein